MDRVSLAIWSFYREDPDLARRLDPLLACRLARGWGCLRIAVAMRPIAPWLPD